MYYKSHDRQNFYSTLCHIAKRNQRYNLIQSTQNDSTSVEHNSKTLAQNNSTLAPNSTFSQSDNFCFMRLSRRISFVVVVRFLFFSYDFASAFVYLQSSERTIDKRQVPTNSLVYAGLNSNSLERALRLNVLEHSITIEIA